MSRIFFHSSNGLSKHFIIMRLSFECFGLCLEKHVLGFQLFSLETSLAIRELQIMTKNSAGCSTFSKLLFGQIHSVRDHLILSCFWRQRGPSDPSAGRTPRCFHMVLLLSV